MKRIKVLFLSSIVLLSSVFLSSCDNNNKVPLYFGYLGGHIENINYAELQEKIDHQDNFLLFVTPKSNCTCWTAFLNNILSPFIKENNLEVWTINYTSFFSKTSESLDTFSLEINIGHQTLGLFKEGALKLNRQYDSKSTLWYDYKTFNEYMFEYIYYPTMYQINVFSDFDKLINDQGKVSLLFYDLKEKESRFLFDFFLKDYAANLVKDKVLYLVNTRVSNIKLDDNLDENATFWQGFIDEYELNTYLNGVLPTLSHYTKDDHLVEQSVYLNDVLDPNLVNGHYQISNSYYDSERANNLAFLSGYKDEKVLVSKLVKESDTFVEDGIRKWSFASASLSHDLLFKAFLDYYL